MTSRTRAGTTKGRARVVPRSSSAGLVVHVRGTRAVVITAGTCSGRARLEGTRVTTARIAELFLAGYTIGDLADQFAVTIGDVDTALRYELKLARVKGGRCAR